MREPAIGSSSSLPLCVDLDGTLVRSNILVEAVVQLLVQRPWMVFPVALWWLKGKAHLQEQLAHQVDFRADALPYRADLLEYLAAERSNGRSIVLASGAHHRFADVVAEHVGLFDAVFAAENGVNLREQPKAEALVRAFGPRGFAYIGSSASDFPIWRAAGEVLCAGTDRGVIQNLKGEGIAVSREFPNSSRNRWLSLLRCLRVHQSLKNILVFVAVLAGHKIGDVHRVWDAILCFIAFSMCSSSAYVLNDMLDLQADRAHPSKCRRPFAAGDLPVWWGAILAPLLLITGLLLASYIGTAVMAMMAIYVAATVLYSIKLKELALIDVLVLAGMYTWRVLTGAAASAVVVSPWLGGFSVFFFLSLALAKRYTELTSATATEKKGVRRRGYVTEDIESVARFGTTSGYLAALVMSLYLNSRDVEILYHYPARLWLILPLLIYWISRVWLLAGRGQLHDDPVIYALKDKTSYITGALVLAVLATAI